MTTVTPESPIVLTVADDVFLARWDFCVRSQDAYAARHAFLRCTQRDPVDGLAMKWSKLAHAARLLRDGHPVLLLDADAEIDRDAPPFTDMLVRHPQAGLLYAIGVSGRANSGVLMLSGPAGLNILEAWSSSRGSTVAPEHFVTADGENGHLITLLASGEFDDRTGLLGPEWNCTRPEHAEKAHVRHYANGVVAEL